MSRSDILNKIFVRSYSWQFWLLIAFLSLVFAGGGSSRYDVQSLAYLYPISIIVFAVALAGFNRLDSQYRIGVGFLILIAMLVGFYLIPFGQAAVEGETLGALVNEVDKLARLEQPRPLAVVPYLALDSFFSLFTPLAVMALAVQLRRDELYDLLPFILAFSIISGLIGLLQILGIPGNPMYFYQVTNDGAAVGLFANRNHQALLLALTFPMLAVFAAYGLKRDWFWVRSYTAIAAGVFIVPLLLVTGSRAGVIFGGVSLLASVLLYRLHITQTTSAKNISMNNWQIPAIGFLTCAIVVLTIILSRATAVDRIFFGDNAIEGRGDFWVVVADMLDANLPLGIGPGGFNAAYAHVEPTRVLDWTYLNHAHNDWMEVGLGFGWLGFILLIAVVIAVATRLALTIRMLKTASRSAAYTMLGAIIIAFIAAASALDYPLRTPIICSLFIIAVIWLTSHGTLRSEQLRSDRLSDVC